MVSPLTARFRFHSRDQAQVMLGAAFEVITDIRVPTLVGDGPGPRVLVRRGRCGAVEVEPATPVVPPRVRTSSRPARAR